MLQNFRDNMKGVTAFLLVGIIIIPFALFGVDSIFLSGSSVEKAATVNGEPISKLRLQQAVAIRKQQILNRFQDISPELIDDQQLQGHVLNELVRQKALQIEAKSHDIVIPQKRVYQALLDTEAFQTEGAFDAEKYDFLLRQQGYTPNSYNALLSEEMAVNQLIRGITGTGFATAQEVALLAGLAEQKRSFYYLTIPAKDVLEQTEIPEEALVAFYEENQTRFMTDEQVIVNYLELSTDMLLQEVTVDEAVLREQYEQEVANSNAAASRRVAHILIEPGNNQQSLLNELVAKLKAGEDFAKLASQYSMDYGTSEIGGDLGFSRPGDLPAKLEVALDALEVGQISGPVASEAGTHILKLLDVKEAAVIAFEERRDALEQTIRQQLATELLLGRIDKLRDLSYNADSLQGTAAELGLDVERSEAFSRQGGAGIAQYPAVVKAAFGEDVLENGYTSEVIELSDSRVVVLSLHERLPAAVKPLSIVRADIEAELRQKVVKEQLLTTAEQYLQRLNSGETIEDIAKAEKLDWQVSLDTRRVGGNMDGSLLGYVFAMQQPDKTPSNGGLFLENNDYVLVSLSKVEQGDISKLSRDQRNGLKASSAMASAGREFQSYQKALLDEAEVSLLVQ